MGRTTLVLQLAHQLVQKGRVLVVDLDPQADATRQLGGSLDPKANSILEVLTGAVAPEQALRPSTENLVLLPADRALGLRENQFPPFGQELLLAHKLKLLTTQFDYTLIDTPSAKGVFTAMALCAADKLLIPVALSPKGVWAATETLAFYHELKDAGLPTGSVLGIAPQCEPLVGRRRLRKSTELLKILETLAPCFPAIPESLRQRFGEPPIPLPTAYAAILAYLIETPPHDPT